MNEELVNLHMKAKTKEEAIKELARNVESAKRIENYEEYVVSVFERENMTSTGIGFKIAIPHGKSSKMCIRDSYKGYYMMIHFHII